MLRFIGWRHDRMGMHLNQVRKLWIALEAKYSKFVFLKSNLFLNQFMGCVDLYDFHENCPRS